MNEQKKILMLNYEFPPLGGGAGNATYYLLKEFAKDKNLDITLVTSSTDKQKEEDFADNIKIYYLDIGKKGNIHYQTQKDLLIYSWKAYWFCKKLKRQKEFDLIHAFFGIPCGYIAMKLKNKFKIPYIVSLRGSDVPFYNKRFYWLDKLIFKRLSKKIWKKAERVVTNSSDLKNLAQKASPNQEIDIIYNGINTEEFFPKQITKEKEDEIKIVSTSRLIARKGIEYLLKGFLKFNKEYKNSKLVLVGDGDLREELENVVLKEGVTNSVDFLGAIFHDKISEIYRDSDVFVLPSLNEGMSNSLLEAIASGLAILSTDTGGAKELIKDCGKIIKKENSEDIFNKLKELKENPQQLEEMKKNARRKAESMSWERVAEKYKEIYENITYN